MGAGGLGSSLGGGGFTAPRPQGGLTSQGSSVGSGLGGGGFTAPRPQGGFNSQGGGFSQPARPGYSGASVAGAGLAGAGLGGLAGAGAGALGSRWPRCCCCSYTILSPGGRAALVTRDWAAQGGCWGHEEAAQATVPPVSAPTVSVAITAPASAPLQVDPASGSEPSPPPALTSSSPLLSSACSSPDQALLLPSPLLNKPLSSPDQAPLLPSPPPAWQAQGWRVVWRGGWQGASVAG